MRAEHALELGRVDVEAARDDALTALIGRADVFVQNLAPGSAERLGLSAAALRASDPALIVCDVSGYAPDGPLGDRRAYALLIQCETGLLSVTGSADAPAKAGISVADIAGGMFAFSSILAALYTRERTGDGAMNTVVDLLDHPQLAHRWGQVDSPAGPLRALPSPISLGGGVAPALGAIQALGEHTEAVLAEFGLADPALADGEQRLEPRDHSA
jgi:crotonobetainyl-CoA:carnitine CoA-transferase CaiB-like acyl-CoA transferase